MSTELNNIVLSDLTKMKTQSLVRAIEQIVMDDFYIDFDNVECGECGSAFDNLNLPAKYQSRDLKQLHELFVELKKRSEEKKQYGK